MQLTIEGTEVPLDEVDSGPERETNPALLAAKQEVRRLMERRQACRPES